MTYVRIDTLPELLALWACASAAERCEFLARVAARARVLDPGQSPEQRASVVLLDGEEGVG